MPKIKQWIERQEIPFVFTGCQYSCVCSEKNTMINIFLAVNDVSVHIKAKIHLLLPRK